MKHGSKTVLWMALAAASPATIAQIDVQAPGVHAEVSAGILGRSDYRDFILEDGSSAFVAGAVATRGFSAAIWSAWGAAEWHEAMAGYSHKLPIADVHLAFVSSKAPYGLGVCAAEREVPDVAWHASCVDRACPRATAPTNPIR